MITVIAGIILLGILVFVHELGHFVVAKLAGVKVLRFSLGFGPRLVSHQWGETEYMICAIPLGGYVKMLGEDEGESGEGQLTPEERQRSFADKPVWRRTAIVAAGPLMNLLLPFLVLPLAYLVGVNLPAFLEQEPCVGYVVAESPAAEAGFQAGDCIVAVNGDSVASWNETNRALIDHSNGQMRFRVQRDRGAATVVLPGGEEALQGLRGLGLLPPQKPVVGGTAPEMPAGKAGMQAGDRIVAIEGEPVASWYDLKGLIQESEGRLQTFVVERDGRRLEMEIAPVEDEADGREYLIGIAPEQERTFKRFGPVEAVRAGAGRSWELIDLTLVFLQKLFTGNVSTKNIGGPITVVQIAGQAAQTDFSSILTVLAFLSIQLGILNLLPIPILDGGHLFFNLIEMIFRRPLSMRAREVAQQIGLLLIVLLMLLAFYNDIVRLLTGVQSG